MWLPATIILIVLNTILFSSYSSDPLIVSLPKGRIRGHVLKTGKNNTYYAFQQIPYAAPPVGALRFSEPVEPESWEGVLNTTQNTKICYQYDILASRITKNMTQTEDCLYINVYTPVAPGETTNELVPVLFYIYGGNFKFADGSYRRYGPQFLIDQKVVVVTFNYRAGPLGFLYTSDGVIPANLGLKDQNLALRWTNENIALFGGDPTKITIGGASSGAALVGYHVASKKSAGLFRGAILQSSSCICDSSFQPNGDYFAYRLGQDLDSSFTTSNSTQELFDVLKNASAEDINLHGYVTDVPDDKINEFVMQSRGINFAPTIESPDYPDAFITNSMYEDLMSGNFNQVPLLIGVTGEESLFVFSTYGIISGAAVDNNLVWAVGNFLNLNSSSAEKAGKLIRSIYTNFTYAEDYQALVRMSSEKLFAACTLKHAELQSNFADVYVYQFSYKGVMAGSNYSTVAGEKVESVSHSDDINYLWSKEFNEDVTKFPDSDVLTLNRMTKMWTNFVKYLNPTPEQDEVLDNYKWPTFKSNNMTFVNISETLDTRKNPKNLARWSEIIDEYGVRPFVTF